MTFYDIAKYLYTNGFNTYDKLYFANDIKLAFDDYGYVSIGISCPQNPDTAQNYQIESYALMLDFRDGQTDHFKADYSSVLSKAQSIDATVYDTVVRLL